MAAFSCIKAQMTVPDHNEPECPELTAEAARVLGCLLEKHATTPDAYPLTLNNLLLACNQKSNRQPVVDYSEDTLADAIEALREHGLVVRVDGAGSRVPKFRHLENGVMSLYL